MAMYSPGNKRELTKSRAARLAKVLPEEPSKGRVETISAPSDPMKLRRIRTQVRLYGLGAANL